MTPYERAIIEALETMTIQEARQEIMKGSFDDDTGHGRSFALSWLVNKESQERERRDKRTRRIAIIANILAAIAIAIDIITMIGL